MALNWVGGIIAGIFVYIGATQLLNNIVTGTSTADTLVTNIVPVVLGAVVVGIAVKVFRG